jgi:pimeloyl-ACP methyl ester carboxylesterase
MTRRPTHTSCTLAFLLALLASFALVSAAAAQPEAPSADWRRDGAGFEAVEDPARELLARLVRDEGALAERGLLDRVYTLEHHVPIGDGRTLFVTESFTVGSWLRHPRRAVLFLSGSAFRGNHWSIPVEGYDGTAMTAQRGMFAFTVDYLGVGESFKPADGLDASFDVNLEALEVLLRYVRFFRGVPKVDVVGAGYGGSLCTQLAADAARVGSCTMSAMLYDVLLGGPLTDPAFVALLESSPDGYFFVPGEGSVIFMPGAPQEAIDYVVATQGGFYPTPNFLVAAGALPFFDPGVARAPGLIIFGPNDFVVGPNGVDQLALDYGTDGAQLAVNPAAGHAPRTESPEIAAWYWEQLFDFIDP